MTKPPDLKEIDAEIEERLNKEKEEAVANQDFERRGSATRPTSSRRRRKQIQRDLARAREQSRRLDGVVDEEVIAEVVSKMTGVPLKRLDQDGSRSA